MDRPRLDCITRKHHQGNRLRAGVLIERAACQLVWLKVYPCMIYSRVSVPLYRQTRTYTVCATTPVLPMATADWALINGFALNRPIRYSEIYCYPVKGRARPEPAPNKQNAKCQRTGDNGDKSLFGTTFQNLDKEWLDGWIHWYS